MCINTGCFVWRGFCFLGGRGYSKRKEITHTSIFPSLRIDAHFFVISASCPFFREKKRREERRQSGKGGGRKGEREGGREGRKEGRRGESMRDIS